MTYYHLAVLPSCQFIYPSSPEFDEKEIMPRIPGPNEEDDHETKRVSGRCEGEERETKRVSIAPTVWGCALSKLSAVERTFHIYEINVESPSDPKGCPSDYAVTGEKWLTDDDVKKSGGTIELKCLGFIRLDGELHDKLTTLREQGKLPRPPDSEDCLWEKHDGEWLLALIFRS